MAIVGRLLRQKWASEAAEARHPEWAAQRIRAREISNQINAERKARWPQITAENVEEIVAWQDARISELHKAEGW